MMSIFTGIYHARILLYSKLVKSQEGVRGISLSRIYSGFKCLNNYEKFPFCRLRLIIL